MNAPDAEAEAAAPLVHRRAPAEPGPRGSRPLRPKHAPLWLLAFVTFSGTAGMHIFVPALPVAGADLGAGIGAMQMTVSLYILGLAVGQLVYGPLADAFGRRPLLLGGLALYTVAGLAAALAPQVHALVAARLFQAIGGCAGVVLGRTIVRDTTSAPEAVRRLALMNLMVSVGPSLAPILGSTMTETMGWRSIFFLLCAMGVVCFVATWRLLPETGRRAPMESAAALGRRYLGLLRSPVFLGFSVGGGCATTSMYAFIAAAPFIFVNQLHRSVHEAGIYLAFLVSGVWLGSVLTSRLITRVRLDRLLVGVNGVSVAAALGLLVIVLMDWLSVPLLIGTMFVFTVGVGAAAPAAVAQATGVDLQMIGSASGLYGFTQMAVGALCTALVGIGDDPALAAGLVLAGAGIVAQASFQMALRRLARGDSRRAEE